MKTFAAGRQNWIALGVFFIAAAAGARIDRDRAAADIDARLAALAQAGQDSTGANACAPSTVMAELAPITTAALGTSLASWQTIGGCGAGASSGSGAGLKWVGRGVTGGMFQVQCQGNYARLPDGYLYSANTLITRNLGEKWNLGVNVPWLYKYWKDPFSFGFDISNQGWGDVAVLLTRRLGPINATSVTATLGIPTGGWEAQSTTSMSLLRQDKQMGHGKFTGGLIVDHTFDNLWGPVVVGGTVDYRGGENKHESYRSPAGSLYSHVGYLLGPFVPAAGLTLARFQGLDRDQGREQERPLTTVAASASIEWSTDYFALLLGGSLPYDLKGNAEPWVVGMGLSVSPF